MIFAVRNELQVDYKLQTVFQKVCQDSFSNLDTECCIFLVSTYFTYPTICDAAADAAAPTKAPPMPDAA